jgi:hypothetical protein
MDGDGKGVIGTCAACQTSATLSEPLRKGLYETGPPKSKKTTRVEALINPAMRVQKQLQQRVEFHANRLRRMT